MLKRWTWFFKKIKPSLNTGELFDFKIVHPFENPPERKPRNITVGLHIETQPLTDSSNYNKRHTKHWRKETRENNYRLGMWF